MFVKTAIPPAVAALATITTNVSLAPILPLCFPAELANNHALSVLLAFQEIVCKVKNAIL